MANYYQSLDLKENCTAAEIKNAYRIKALELHPDKNSAVNTTEHFAEIQKAYEVLRNKKSRTEHDEYLKASANHKAPVNKPFESEIDLDECAFDEISLTYKYPCRCGGDFVVTESMLESGITDINCDSCSLHIKLYYQLA